MTARQTRTRAIVLAAGQGKRMLSEKPKVLHEVMGKAILWRLLKAIDDLSLEHIHVVIGHGASEIQQYVSSLALQTPVSCHLQEPQLGTGHAVLAVEAALKDFDGDLLVTYGDSPLLTSKTLSDLMEVHHKQGADISLLTTVVENAYGYGRIVRSAKGAVIGVIEEKDATVEQRKINEINPGMYFLRYPFVLKGLRSLSNKNKQGEYYLTDLIAWGVVSGAKLASSLCPDWQEVAGINTRVELAQANRALNERVATNLALTHGVTIVDPQSTWIAPEVRIEQDTVVMPGCWLVGNVTIGRGCTIGPFTTMTGTVDIGSGSNVTYSHLVDCQVGNDCQIGPFARLRAGTVLSDQVKVGNFVEIKQSFLGLASKASHLSYVGDTTVGNDANLGAGTITANYDHITKIKSRTVIGDQVSTGVNSVLVAPVTLGEGSVIGAGSVITKNVPPGALAVGRARQEIKEGWSEARKKKRKTEVEGEAKQKTENKVK